MTNGSIHSFIHSMADLKSIKRKKLMTIHKSTLYLKYFYVISRTEAIVL